MPAWLADLLTQWAPFAGVAVFVLGLIGAAMRGIYGLFASGTIMSKSRHLETVTFYETQLRICKEAADRRIAEQRQDIEDLEKDRDQWRDRFWRAAEAGTILVKRDTPPRGMRRPDTGA